MVDTVTILALVLQKVLPQNAWQSAVKSRFAGACAGTAPTGSGRQPTAANVVAATRGPIRLTKSRRGLSHATRRTADSAKGLPPLSSGHVTGIPTPRFRSAVGPHPAPLKGSTIHPVAQARVRNPSKRIPLSTAWRQSGHRTVALV